MATKEKKVTATPFMNVQRILKTNRTFEKRQYEAIILTCYEQIEERKKAFIEKQNQIIAEAKKAIDDYDKIEATKKPKPKP